MHMNTELSSDTKATLLLTAPLIISRQKRKDGYFPRPLTFAEFGKLAQRLRDYRLQVGELIGPRATEILDECQIGLDRTQIAELLKRGFQLSQAVENWRARAIWVVSHADEDYPVAVTRRLGGIVPPVIYGCGDRSLLEEGGLAVVGSRDVSNELTEYAETVGRIAATAQCTIVSGGARGVDRAAMHGALVRGGTVVGVLADGLEKEVMRRENRSMIMDGHLTLISPYDPRAGFSVGNAMRRNKLIYALADAGLVVKTAYNKGGTWAGAVEQLDKLRSTPVFVHDDGTGSRGIEELQRKGAHLWPNPQTPDEFRSAISNKHLYSEAEVLWRSTFRANTTDTDETAKKRPPKEVTSLTSGTTAFEDGVSSPADALFGKVEELLLSIDTPTTESDVAAFLEVSKSQAREWLKRLVLEGKYERSTRPVRYGRVQ